MLKNPTSGWRRLSWLAILPFLAGTMFLANPVRAKVVSAGPVFLPVTAAGQPEAVAQVPDTTNAVSFTLLDPECKPKFNGKDAAEFSKWFYENVQYPEAAKQSGAQGRITVRFTIGTDGKVGDVKVLRGVDPELDAEAVRVVSASPDWTPGTVNGKPVKVNYLFPVIFKTQDTKKETGQEGESSPGITIRGTATDSILVVIDGKPGYTLKEMKELDINTVESIQVLKEEAALKKYGEKARNGAIEVMTKKKK